MVVKQLDKKYLINKAVPINRNLINEDIFYMMSHSFGQALGFLVNNFSMNYRLLFQLQIAILWFVTTMTHAPFYTTLKYKTSLQFCILLFEDASLNSMISKK